MSSYDKRILSIFSTLVLFFYKNRTLVQTQNSNTIWSFLQTLNTMLGIRSLFFRHGSLPFLKERKLPNDGISKFIAAQYPKVLKIIGYPKRQDFRKKTEKLREHAKKTTAEKRKYIEDVVTEQKDRIFDQHSYVQATDKFVEIPLDDPQHESKQQHRQTNPMLASMQKTLSTCASQGELSKHRNWGHSFGVIVAWSFIPTIIIPSILMLISYAQHGEWTAPFRTSTRSSRLVEDLQKSRERLSADLSIR